MKYIWVVEVKFVSGEWSICNWREIPYASTNFFEAHKYKRQWYEYLKSCAPNLWTKKHFRITKYFGEKK